MIMPAHPDELKECAVRLCLDALKDPQRARGRFKRVGDQLGINSETLRGWVRQVQVDAGDRHDYRGRRLERTDPGPARERIYAVLGSRKTWRLLNVQQGAAARGPLAR